uniref:ELKS/RAB6-interacting/CAST family member 1 n=1 Tax=Macaca nemestrina TaxID=9545 RepID=A0A2K6BYY5_MACNE
MYGSARSVGKVEPSNQSPGRSPRLPRSPRLGHRRTNSTGGSSGSSVGGGSGKTLSMENIQSLNAAYATSGPMYLSDHENVGSETPKSTMTLGRSGGRLPYGVRMTAMGSSPNIASSGVASDTIAFGEHHLPPVSMASTVPHSLRQARDNTIMDLQTQLKEVLRENDLLRKDVEVKESKLSSSMNSIKTFWSPELKKERALRKDEASKITIWKEQYRVVQEENQVDALRLRLEEKETMLNKKTKQIQDMAEEKGTQAGEIHDLKDMLDVKERKVNVLQKKIENLQEQLRDKEKQMSSLKERVKSLQADTTNTDTALTTLEEALAEKQLERLKEQRDRDEARESALCKATLSGERGKASLLDLKEHASSLASSGLKKDSRLKTLEIALEQKKEECLKMESQLKKAHEAALEARASPEMSDRIQHLEREITRYKDESSKAQAEVDRLLEILKEVENEKNDKDKKIAELERQVKDQNKKVANLKHKEQVEKKKSAQMLEEARRREDNLNDSSQQLQDSLRKKDDRIEELEEALRESVQITAEREMVLAQEESARTNAEKQVEELLMAMEKVKQELESMKAKLSSTQQSLAEKETHLTNLRAERRKHLEEVLEMKQEALLAAISEKDANIALLELSSSKKKTQEEVAALKREKDRLVQQLKQQVLLNARRRVSGVRRSRPSGQHGKSPSPLKIQKLAGCGGGRL